MKSAEYRRRLGRYKPLNNAGDALVEVLIAMLVVSMVLSGVFLTSRTSLVGMRQAEERGEALKIAELQVEELRSAGAPHSALIEPYNPFCFDPNDFPSPTFSNPLHQQLLTILVCTSIPMCRG